MTLDEFQGVSKNNEQTPVALLQRKFAKTGFRTVAKWMRMTKIDLSLQSCTNILHRGSPMGLAAMLILGAELQCTSEELIWIAKELGDNTLWRLFTTNPISKHDEQILNGYHALSPEMQNLIRGVIASSGEVSNCAAPYKYAPGVLSAAPSQDNNTKEGKGTMTLTEVIIELQKILVENGDLNVMIDGEFVGGVSVVPAEEGFPAYADFSADWTLRKRD
jgi:hypothetical protein